MHRLLTSTGTATVTAATPGPDTASRTQAGRRTRIPPVNSVYRGPQAGIRIWVAGFHGGRP